MLQRTNLNILKKNRNVDLNFRLNASDRSNPHTIIPQKIYTDFDRKNYKRHTLSFPIKVPVWYRKVPAHKDYTRFIRDQPLVANYAHMTGNQLLLTLLRYTELDQQELSEVFFNLSVNPETKNLRLEKNKIVEAATNHIIKESTAWKMGPLTRTLFSMYVMGFKDEKLWGKVRPNFIQKIYAYEHISSTFFAEMFIMFFDKFKDTITESEKGLLVEQLPRYLYKMTPELYVKMFEMTLELGVLTSHKEYLFERHFFMAFWKLPGRWNLSEATKILKGLRRLEYFNVDKEFYEVEFLPVIMKKVIYSTDNKELNDLYIEVEELKMCGINENVLDGFLNKISQRLLFVEKKLAIIGQTEFISVVRSDLAKFRGLQLAKLIEKGKVKAEPGLLVN